MKRLLMTAAVAALILPAAACQDETTLAEADTTADETTMAEDVDNDGIPDATDTDITEPAAADPMDTYPTTADATDETTMAEDVDNDGIPDATDTDITDPMATADAGMAGMAEHLMPGEISAEYALDATITGSTGEQIAEVDDLLIDQSGKIGKVVFNEGGDKRAVDAAQAKLVATDVTEGDAKVTVSLTEEQLDAATPFDQEGLNDYRLASEILGAEVDITASEDDEARITDIIFDSSGMAKNVIVQRSAVGVSAGDKYAFDYSKLEIAQGDAGLVLNVSETELNEANKFEYSMDAATEEAMDADVDTPDEESNPY